MEVSVENENGVIDSVEGRENLTTESVALGVFSPRSVFRILFRVFVSHCYSLVATTRPVVFM
ncbi:hypothetical protein [Haloferax sp. YSSS75]|uniref:hypothetical protein n=1 Tax=Haloferax sp. YSSS75 TaxID=3388564 RepID=UPI00398CC54E